MDNQPDRTIIEPMPFPNGMAYDLVRCTNDTLEPCAVILHETIATNMIQRSIGPHCYDNGDHGACRPDSGKEGQ